jgi:hypothetical protein
VAELSRGISVTVGTDRNDPVSDILIRPEKGLAHFGDFGGVDQTSW